MTPLVKNDVESIEYKLSISIDEVSASIKIPLVESLIILLVELSKVIKLDEICFR
jgi:hypothetical protein